MERGMQALFPLYLSRRATEGESREEADSLISMNESNLNQNFHILYTKILELEAALWEREGGTDG